MKTTLGRPLSQLQETARYIAQTSNECKFPLNEDEYVDSFQPTLMDVVHAWSKVSVHFSCPISTLNVLVIAKTAFRCRNFLPRPAEATESML